MAAALLLTVAACSEHERWDPSPIRSEVLDNFSSESIRTFEFTAEALPVLIEVSGSDVNLRSRVLNGNGDVLSEIEPAFLRSAPVYHLVEAGANQSLRLEILPKQFTERAAIAINWYRLPADSEQDRELADAWRALVAGLQFVEGEDPANWRPNNQALKRAATSFARLGLFEQALWARYFNAYFDYYPLYRYSEALADTQTVIDKARDAGLTQLEMLCHQLAGQILVEREAGLDEAQARRDYAAAQVHFAEALRLAQAAGNGFETIWSINNMGIASKYQDKPQKALDEYERALDLAIELGDSYLVNLIGGNTAVAQESLGHIRRAIETLERIESELSAEREPAELEHIWSLQAGFYLKLYDFPTALERVTKALALAEQLGIAESLGRNHLLLGQIYRELGQEAKSQLNVELAIPHLQASRNGRGLKRAYALAADLYRQSGRFVEMQHARSQQSEYLANDADRALWIWSSALDAQAQGDEARAPSLFESSAVLFARTSLGYVGELAMLQACLIRHATGAAEACSSTSMNAATKVLRTHQASAYALQGRYLWARLLAMEGQPDMALGTMEQLIEDMLYLRQTLPGVLGAWYWDARTTLFDFYLELAVTAPQDEDLRAFASLQALGRLRNLGLTAVPSAATSMAASTTPGTQRLRELMALRERAATAAEVAQAQREIDLALLDIRQSGATSNEKSEPADLRASLAALPAEWSLLTYHFSDDRALAWTASVSGLRLHELGRGEELRGLLREAREEIRTLNSDRTEGLLAELGNHLIVSLSPYLQTDILFLGAGGFSDFPLEALIVDGNHLVANYRVHNILSLSNLEQLAATLNQPFRPHRLFLAGAPDLRDTNLQALPGSARELQAVADRFPEAINSIVTGNQLIREVFDEAAFASADLVHIASHASIDLAYPELSRIELSNGFLTTAELSGRHLAAAFVFLSACSTAGSSRFEYDSQLGFVTEFLNAGTDQVLATLWPIPDQSTERFVGTLYGELAKGANIAEAVRYAKLDAIESGTAGVERWSSFQLFVR